MAVFVFITETNSIAAEYFSQIIRKKTDHRFEIVSSVEDALRLQPDFFMLTAYDQAEEYFLAKGWIEKIKRFTPTARIVLGGPAFKSRPVAFFRNLKADYALKGEADFTFSLLADEITKKKPDSRQITEIPGVMFLDNGRLVVNQEYPSLTRNQLEALDFSHYCMYEGDMVSMLTERGCPYGCTFCSRIFGKRIRFLSIDRIIEILKEISKKPHIQRVMFANDNMIYSLRRAHKLFGRIIEEKLNHRFKFLINGRIDNFLLRNEKYLPHGINLELVDLLQSAGVSKISFGTESFNDAEIKRLKPEALYRGVDAMRLTRVLGKAGITVVHFLLEPSPDAMPEEAIESTWRRLVVMESYPDYIEKSASFANPSKIFLVRGSGLYLRGSAKDFEVKDINGNQGCINEVEKNETEFINDSKKDFYLPFLTPVNRFGTTSDPYMNLLLLEEELKNLLEKEKRSQGEDLRLKRLVKQVKVCRKYVNRINAVIKNINEKTVARFKEMLAEIGGVGKFLQEFLKLSGENKREQIAGITQKFEEASRLGPIDAFEADTLQIFYMYILDAVKELLANSGKEKQTVKKYKKITHNVMINKMMLLRRETPLNIYMNYLKKSLPTDQPSINILKKYAKNNQ